MCRTFGLAVAVALWLAPATGARAQYGLVVPGYGSYGVTYGYGMPYGFGVTSGYNYGLGPGFGYGYGLGPGVVAPYGGVFSRSFGFAPGAPIPGTTYYRTAYSGFVTPGVSSYALGYAAPYASVPAYGYGNLGGGSGRTGYVATAPFMGLPRPFAGLVPVPR
jgi:hypothetical protein